MSQHIEEHPIVDYPSRTPVTFSFDGRTLTGLAGQPDLPRRCWTTASRSSDIPTRPAGPAVSSAASASAATAL